jgi:hypothetical protein
MFALFDAILSGRDDFPENLSYTHHGLVKIPKYKVIQGSHGYEDQRQLRPGDDYSDQRVARFNNIAFPIVDEDDFHHRKNRRRRDHGKPTHWFEKYGPLGIEVVHRQMAADDLTAPAPKG